MNYFNKVQENLKSNFNKLAMNQKYTYLLNKKLMICGICGKPYAPNSRPTEKTYKCRSKTYRGEGCGNSGVNVAKIEDAVKDLIREYYDDILLEKLDDVAGNEAKLNRLIIEKEEVEVFLKKQEKTEDNLIDLFTDGRINREKFDEKLSVIKKAQTKIKNQLVNVNGQIRTIKQIIENFNESANEENIKGYGIHS